MSAVGKSAVPTSGRGKGVAGTGEMATGELDTRVVGNRVGGWECVRREERRFESPRPPAALATTPEKRPTQPTQRREE